MKRVKKILANRIVLTSILVLLQLGFILIEVMKLRSYYVYISFWLKIISILVAFYLIYKPMNPEMKIAWIVPVLLVPVFGGLIFLLYGHVIIPTKLRGNLAKVKESKIKDYIISKGVLKEIEKENIDIANQCRYIENYGGMPVYNNSKAHYYGNGEKYFKDLVEALKHAKKFIFIESFIIKKGEMWNTIHNILKEKVKNGIEVRVMYDDVGSGFSLPGHYAEKLQTEGIKSIAFNKLFPLLDLILNHRDHRKIIVVDGKVAFTGGMNIADEYIHKKEIFGHWKDAAIKVEGEAVWSFTVMFLQMWNAMNLTEKDYLPYKETSIDESKADGYIQPYGSAPLEEERIGETVYFNMLSSAKRYIYIYTPYFIVDYNMLSEIKRAAKRGVDVRIVTPGIPDKKQIYWLTQSYYEELLEAGICIMQYTPGFLHAKCVLCDDELASIGTINFDYRSFYHHFECSTLFYKSSVCSELRYDMEKTFEKCTVIDKVWCKKYIKKHHVLGLLLKLFSPLL